MKATSYWQQPQQCTWLHALSAEQQHWVTDPHSLTERLEHLFGDPLLFHLDANNWQQADDSEMQALNIENEPTWVRSISFSIKQQPLILARTIMPQSSCQNPALNPRFDQPIGKILFKEPSLIRHPFEYQAFDSQDSYLKLWDYSFDTNNPTLARRSVVIFQKLPLLITELFMPALLNRLMD